METRSSGTVLLVDDEHRVLEALSLLFWNQPYKVMTAASGAIALELMSENAVDVVVADEHMPIMRGSELLRQVRKEYPETIRVVLSGRMTLDSAVRAVNDGGVFRLLQKPAPSALLLATIAEGMRLRTLVHSGAEVLRAMQGSFGGGLQDLDGLSTAHSRLSPTVHASPAPVPIISTRDPDTLSRISRLSERELEVLKLIASGMRVSRIAPRLFISKFTVRNHLKAIFRKMEVHSQEELMKCCREPEPEPEPESQS
ncbi:MAG: response regulator [Polyangiaceae bacterium]|nr:response regulator [Polyangiaceae bacterium]